MIFEGAAAEVNGKRQKSLRYGRAEYLTSGKRAGQGMILARLSKPLISIFGGDFFCC